MTELALERLRENLENLKMKNTLKILDNYLERAVKDIHGHLIGIFQRVHPTFLTQIIPFLHEKS